MESLQNPNTQTSIFLNKNIYIYAVDSPKVIHKKLLINSYLQGKSKQFAIMVQVGDSIPSIELTEGNPGGKVNLATELASGPGLVIGVPAAFSKFLFLILN